ncbi:hypothetical protein ACFXPX_04530 [Kitasatospora sp. NPDC059146]|uniref:hypothetical protein n=1 Tax=unclassified Kitasatospora TaxID=2633591 RepID=UPI0036AE440D
MHCRPSPFDATGPRTWRGVRRVNENDLAAAVGELVPDLVAVWVLYAGIWHPAVVTGWRLLRRPGQWAARVQWAPAEAAWVHYKGGALKPVLPQRDNPADRVTEDSR